MGSKRVPSLGPPAIGALVNLFWGWEGSLITKVDYRKKLIPLFEPLYWRS